MFEPGNSVECQTNCKVPSWAREQRSVLGLLKMACDQHPVAGVAEATARAGTNVVTAVVAVCNVCMGRPVAEVPEDIAAKRQNPNLL